jgi:hypothetical protein
LRERFDSLSNLDRPRVSASVREETAEIGPPNPGFAVESAEMNYVSPAQLYSNVLAVHFAELKGVASAEHRPLAAPTLAAHQERAYERARDIVDRYGGVIIADAVGLGKTFVGLRLLEREVEGGGDALVIAPAALRDQWQHELSYLRAYAGQSAPCQGPPRPEQNLELWVQEALAGRVSLLSMESLGRPVTNAAQFQEPWHATIPKPGQSGSPLEGRATDRNADQQHATGSSAPHRPLRGAGRFSPYGD